MAGGEEQQENDSRDRGDGAGGGKASTAGFIPCGPCFSLDVVLAQGGGGVELASPPTPPHPPSPLSLQHSATTPCHRHHHPLPHSVCRPMPPPDPLRPYNHGGAPPPPSFLRGNLLVTNKKNKPRSPVNIIHSSCSLQTPVHKIPFLSTLLSSYKIEENTIDQRWAFPFF